jgi:hypothetical protein
MDLRWTSHGGLLVDGTGDIAVTTSAMEELQTMVATRLKAGPRSWKLYPIGAGLDSVIGASTGINQNTELAIQRRCLAATSDLLPAGSLKVQTVTLKNPGFSPLPRLLPTSRSAPASLPSPRLTILPSAAWPLSVGADPGLDALPSCASGSRCATAQNLRISCALPDDRRVHPGCPERIRIRPQGKNKVSRQTGIQMREMN